MSKRVARSGAAVVLVAHQPSSKAFDLMDHFIFMHKGRFLYQGPGRQVTSYFENRGYAVPMNYNPADWIIEVSQTNSEETLIEAGFFKNFPSDESEDGSSVGEEKPLAGDGGGLRLSIFDTVKGSERISVAREFRVQLFRDLRSFKRDSYALGVRFGISLGGGALMAFCLQGAGEDSFEDPAGFARHVGAIFFVTFSLMLINQFVFLDVGEQHPLFVREYRTDHYGILTYAITKSLIEAMITVVTLVPFFLVIFWSMSFTGRFWYWILATCLFGQVCVALAQLIACAFVNPMHAREIAPVVTLPQVLLTGFLVSPDDLPSYIRWLQWIFPYTYIFRLLLAEEFSTCMDYTVAEQHVSNCITAAQNSLANGGDTQGWSSQFDAESKFIVSGTGIYVGPKDIPEYFATISPGEDALALTWNSCNVSWTIYKLSFRMLSLSKSLTLTKINHPLQIKGSQSLFFRQTSDDSCHITIAETMYTRLNSLIISEDAVQAPWVEIVRGQKVHFTYQEDLSSITVESVDLYLPDSLYPVVGEGNDLAKSVDVICQRMVDSCPETLEYNGFSDISDCRENMSLLPKTTTNSLGMTTYDGNSTTCRIVHSALASTNKMHCAHISFLPMEDVNGNLKCTGEGSNLIPDFDERDMNAFSATALNAGLNSTHLRTLSEEEVDLGSCFGPLIDPMAITSANILPPTYTCAQYLEIQDATGSRDLQYWLTLAAMFVVFRIGAFYLLRRKAIKGKRE